MTFKITIMKHYPGTLSLVALLVCLLAVPWAVAHTGPNIFPFTQETSQHSNIPKTTTSISGPKIQIRPSILTPSSPLPPGAHEATWNQTYGGTNTDIGEEGTECSGGGFALTGWTQSFGGSDRDVWLVRTDEFGNHLWNVTFGGSDGDYGMSVIECSGGGFVVAGYTGSFGSGSNDVWLIRTDASGNHLWNKTYGGTSSDQANSVVECSGGGFAIAGYTASSGAGAADFWLIRTDASGTLQWSKTFGGSSGDVCESLVECSGGGFALTGSTGSFGAGGADIWFVRTDASGNYQWNQTFGGSNDDYSYSVVECSSGGFALAGKTKSFVVGFSPDLWLIRTDSSGNHQWNKTYGGYQTDEGYSLVEHSGGGFLVAGHTTSFDIAGGDMWLVRTDANGDHLWNETYGSSSWEYGYSVVECSDAGFAIAGRTASYGAGQDDFWLLRIPDDLNWVEIPTDQFSELNYSFRYDLNASSPDGIDEWWINDTTNFDITDQGVITNKTAMGAVDTLYGVQVWVNDTTNEVLTAEFTITVVETSNPIWDPTPTDRVIEYCTGLSYDVDATDPSGIDYYWINDTTTFSVSGSGLITNITALPVGVYWLEVRAIDPYANYCSATIKITVQDTIDPVWVTTINSQTLVDGWLNIHLEASDHSGIALWTINDTVNFVIDYNGHLTSYGTLGPGVYGLTVTATDPYGNYCSVTVTITVVGDTTDPTWNPTPIDQVIEYGSCFCYDVDATDPSGITDYWINNSITFTIDTEGLITNVTAIPVGIYWLVIRAYDPYGQYCSVIIKITVQDTIDPTWVFPPTDTTLEYGEALDLQLVASDLSGIAQWTINDTTHFTIGTTGYLTNTTILDPGTYGLTVTATDPYGNSCSATFTITVEAAIPLAPPIPGFPLAAILLGAAAGLGVGLVSRRRYRKESPDKH